MHVVIRRSVLLLLVLAAAGAVVWAFLPEPVPVEAAEVRRGPMRVTVNEDGVTRIKERYVVSAPLAGRLRRITLDPGDPVSADDTVLAAIEPTDPQLLDARARAEAEARVRAAEAAVHRAEAELERARSVLEFATQDYERAQSAFDRSAVTDRELDEKLHARRTAIEGERAAQFAQEIALFELEQARSALLHTRGEEAGEQTRFDIHSPISGRVLRVFQESVAVVNPGTPLLEVGDPVDLEIVVDVLSTDAVRIRPGAEVDIERWGGPNPLPAVVRLVEPSAFTKISALGVEEQRVNVIADFTGPLEQRAALGDAYRVEAAIVLWQADDVLQVPASALFRHRGRWAVFVVEGGRAVLRPVEIGRQNATVAQVVDGLAPGETVIVHPGDRIADGVKVVAVPPA